MTPAGCWQPIRDPRCSTSLSNASIPLCTTENNFRHVTTHSIFFFFFFTVAALTAIPINVHGSGVFIGYVLPSDYYLIVLRVDLFHRGFRFAGILGALELQYPNRTFGHEDHNKRHVDDSKHDERTVDDVPIEVRQSCGDQNAARKENAVQRQ